jgi:hypothetical protein
MDQSRASLAGSKSVRSVTLTSRVGSSEAVMGLKRVSWREEIRA